MLDLEKFIGERFPDCIKSILIASGYETMTSLSRINASEILAIEEYINQNRNILKDLHCCSNEIYKNQEKFHFLPGHRAVISTIPSQIDAMKDRKMKRISEAKKPPPPTVISMSEKELKSSLVTKFVRFIAKNGFDLQDGLLTESNIIEFNRGENDVMCRFSCPFCVKVISLRYFKYWQTSNVTSHLKSHILEDIVPEAEN